jgi:hypothetical protein
MADNNVEDAAEHIRKVAPRLADVTNLTVISFSLLQGARRATRKALHIRDDVREVVQGFCDDLARITVVRLASLLDADNKAISFQSINKWLQRPDVVDALAAGMRDDPFQPESIEDDVRQAVERFLTIYQGIDWELHGRLIHLRNQGVAHISPGRLRKSITHDELCSLVGLVKSLGDRLGPFTPRIASIRQNEVTDRVNLSTAMWRRALSVQRRRGG